MKNFYAFSTAVFLIIFSMAAGFYMGRYTDWVITTKKKVIQVSYSDKEQKIKRLLSLIESKYIKKVDTNQIIEETIRHIISQLDTHSIYIPKEQVDKARQFIDGEYIGLGIKYRMIQQGVLLITRVLEESVNKTLLAPGDRILEIEGQKLKGKNTREIQEIFNKKNMNPLSLGILKAKNKSFVHVLAKKQKIITSTIDAAYMLNNNIGYIKLARFGKNSFNEFHRALLYLRGKGMKELALDLRDNPGGRFDMAKKIANEFLEKGQLITFTKEKNGEAQRYYANGEGKFKKGKLYVFINEKSASSSEILAGAIQDHQRGVVIGRPSLGKASIQEEINLGDRSVLRLTVANYYTPSGRNIQKNSSDRKNIYRKNIEEINKYVLLYKKPPYHKDFFNSKISKDKRFSWIYGGICPDVLIPRDTSESKKWLEDSEILDILNDLATLYVDRYRESLMRYDLETFMKKFSGEEIIKKMFSKSNRISELNIKNRKSAELYLKAFTGCQLFGKEVFYKVLHSKDEMIRQILN